MREGVAKGGEEGGDNRERGEGVTRGGMYRGGRFTGGEGGGEEGRGRREEG